jgi:hypothetical protein
MAAPPASAGSSEEILLIFALIIFSVARRTYYTHRGTRFSSARTTIFAVFYVLLGVGFSALSFYEGVPIYLAAVYAVLLIASAVWSYGYADKRITFWTGGDGALWFKGGVVIYIIYVIGLIARLAIDYIVIGPDIFSISTIALTGTALYATIATDLLLVFGVGLLLGRNLKVLKRYQMIKEGKEIVPDSPGPQVQPATDPSQPGPLNSPNVVG